MVKDRGYVSCKHCGTPVYGGADKCPNCDKNPYAPDEEGLYGMKPKVRKANKTTDRSIPIHC